MGQKRTENERTQARLRDENDNRANRMDKIQKFKEEKAPGVIQPRALKIAHIEADVNRQVINQKDARIEAEAENRRLAELNPEITVPSGTDVMLGSLIILIVLFA